MFLPDRYIKGECPKCGAKDQYGDSCEVCGSVYAPTDLKNPYSTLTGATPVLKSSEHFFFRLSDPQCVSFLRQWTQAPGRLQPEVANKALEWLAKSPEATARASPTGTSRAIAPYFGIPIPDAPGKYFYVWLDAPVGYLASLKADLASKGIALADFLRGEGVEQYHFIGKDIVYFHTLFWPAMLKFAGAPYKVPDNIFVHGFITFTGEKMSKSRGTGISPELYLDLGLESRVAALLHRRQAQRQGRGPRFQSRRFHRAGQQRPDRQVRQHREPRRALHRADRQQAGARRPDSMHGTAWPCMRCRTGSRSCTRTANSARPCAR